MLVLDPENVHGGTQTYADLRAGGAWDANEAGTQ